MRIGIDGGGTKTKGVLYQDNRQMDEINGGKSDCKLRACSIKCSTSY